MVDGQTANKVSEDITKLLNEKIDQANKDPRLMYGRSEGEWYHPIRRTIFRAENDYWEAPQCSFRNCRSPCWGIQISTHIHGMQVLNTGVV